MDRKQILDAATECVMKDRNATHGDPEDNFKTIAKYWSTYMTSTYGALIEFTLQDVAALMILVKMSRLSTSPSHPDHWIDIAGYAACGGSIATKETK